MKKQKGGNKKEESGRLSRFLPFVLVCVKFIDSLEECMYILPF